MHGEGRSFGTSLSEILSALPSVQAQNTAPSHAISIKTERPPFMHVNRNIHLYKKFKLIYIGLSFLHFTIFKLKDVHQNIGYCTELSSLEIFVVAS